MSINIDSDFDVTSCWAVTSPNPRENQVGGSHYKDMPIQPAEFIAKNNIPWIEGNVIKYVVRHKNKNGEQDIDKAIHFLELLKEYEYGQTPE